MKLVKTTTLVYLEGRTERVYEIDLCEVGPGQFVVNFRYGKRGAALKDGTKTVAPVAQAEAERIFDKLVAQQREKGYLPEGAPRPAPPVAQGPTAAVAPVAVGAERAGGRQKQRILDVLAQAAAAARGRTAPPPRPTAPPPPADGVPAMVASFSVQQGFGVAQLDSGQSMSFDIAVTSIAPAALRPGLRVRVDIGPGRVPGRLVIRAMWAEGSRRVVPGERAVQQPTRAPSSAGGSLERVIWRAGELQIREAEPHLLALVGTAGTMRDYCIVWALGRLGSDASMETLARLYRDEATADAVRRIATLALQALSDATARAEFAEHLVTLLPAELQGPARGSDPAAFAAALRDHLAKTGPAGWGVVDLLYVMDTEAVRPAVLAELAVVPLAVPHFYWVRHIFKAAEYRRDARVYGLLAYRIEKTRPNFSGANYAYRYARGREVKPQAFGGDTRRYLRRRVWRTLRRAARDGDLDYVKLAVGVLLPFRDEDAVEPRQGGFRAYDRWAPYWAFNHILYGNSPRYEPGPNGKSFRVKRTSRVGAPAPAAREESFPKLWEAKPEGLMHLLAESACAPVHELATKAIRACTAFLASLEVDDVIVLLGRPYDVTAKLGLELAEKRYDRSAPNMALVIAAALSVYAPARAKGAEWLDEQRARLLEEASLVAKLVVAPFADTREAVRRILRSSSLAPNVGAVIVARVVAAMLALPGTPEADACARDATQTLVAALAPYLVTIGPAVVKDLLSHALSGVQELGAELLLRSKASALEDAEMLAILHSEHANVRAVGMRLLAEMPDDVLARMELLLARLSADKNADLRNASRPIVRRVALSNPGAGETIARALVEALLRRKLPEGAPSHILAILKEDLFTLLASYDAADVWRLLQSGSAHAQELGGLLLKQLGPDALSIDQVVKLASHDILSVRQAAWSFYERSLDKVRANLAEASRILDAKWDDSRAFAFGFFRERIGESAYTAEVLVTILDSVREDVQAFGRELTTKYFREEDGPALMTKLSEHPSVSVQLFTTNYLARYATDRPGTLESLVPYFTSVLSRVNKGRVAKQRVLSFLEAEGTKNEESARVVLGILHRVSATMTVELRGAAIASMVAIHHARPGVVVPLQFRAPPVRTAGSGA